MAKSKASYWLTSDGLTLLSGWAREGLTDEQIAHNTGISRSTLKEWKKKYPTISAALKKAKEIVDYEVENALLQKCFGYNVKVLKHVKLKTSKYNKNGFKISEKEEIIEVYDEVHVPADTTAQIIWLKNRQPNKWRDKPKEATNENEGVIIVDDLPKQDSN